MAKLDNDSIRYIIKCLLTDGSDYRTVIFRDINRQFIRHVSRFLDEAAAAKVRGEELGLQNWYTEGLLPTTKGTNDVGIVGGVPKKTVFNIRGKATRRDVLEFSIDNLDHLSQTLTELTAAHHPGFKLRISHDDRVEFDTEESILIINSLAVKRQQISAGMWGAVGFAVERPLMAALCELYQVDRHYYRGGADSDGKFQVDFMLMKAGAEYRCEVKLNGRGNPESVTQAISRDARLLVADWISDQNRQKLTGSQIHWVCLSDHNSHQQFGKALKSFGIDFVKPDDLSTLDSILLRLLPDP